MPLWGVLCACFFVVGVAVGGVGGFLLAVKRAPRIVARMTDPERSSFAQKVATHRDSA